MENTPEKVGELFQYAITHLREYNSFPKAIFINAWNEWTEGMFLLPEKQYGTEYLENIKTILEKYK